MRLTIGVLTFGLLCALGGCQSREARAHERALAQAKEKAAVTGAVQTLTYRDPDGKIVTTVIQPPAPGEATERVTVTRSR